ncbi:MAG: ribonuclease III domain-containing protein [Cyanobacteria bacterium P01_G01_bin.38]
MQDQSLQIQSLSPIALAYVGDAVYELYIRTQLLWPPQRPQAYHDAVVTQVRAEQQATSLERLQPYLNEIEQAMVRKGRNAAPKRQRRVRADTYQRATSFETLIGYLYLTDPSRLFELLNQLNKVQS